VGESVGSSSTEEDKRIMRTYDEPWKALQHIVRLSHTDALSSKPLCVSHHANATQQEILYAIRAMSYDGNRTPQMTVTLRVQLQQLLDVDQKLETISIAMGMTTRWTDCRLAWNESVSGALNVEIAPPKFKAMHVYQPAINLLEMVELQPSDDASMRSVDIRNGELVIYREMSAELACAMDVSMYPFDVHECNMTFEPPDAQYSTSLQKLKEGWGVTFNAVSLFAAGRFQASDAWMVAMLHADVDPRSDYGDPSRASWFQLYSRIRYRLILRRHPNYQVINLLVPALLVVTISSCILLLPTSSGDKLSLSVTILLSMLLFTQLMYDTMPDTGSTVPLLSKYIQQLRNLYVVAHNKL
jgi:hypothetical protein